MSNRMNIHQSFIDSSVFWMCLSGECLTLRQLTSVHTYIISKIHYEQNVMILITWFVSWVTGLVSDLSLLYFLNNLDKYKEINYVLMYVAPDNLEIFLIMWNFSNSYSQSPYCIIKISTNFYKIWIWKSQESMKKFSNNLIWYLKFFSSNSKMISQLRGMCRCQFLSQFKIFMLEHCPYSP